MANDEEHMMHDDLIEKKHLKSFFLLPSDCHFGHRNDIPWRSSLNYSALNGCNGEYCIKEIEHIKQSYYIMFPFDQLYTQDVRISIVIDCPFFCYIDDKLVYWNDRRDSYILTFGFQSGKHCLYFQIPGTVKKFNYSIQIWDLNADDEFKNNYFINHSLYIKEQQNDNEYRFLLGDRNYVSASQKNELFLYDSNNRVLLHKNILLDKEYIFDCKENMLPVSDIYYMVISGEDRQKNKQIIKAQFTLNAAKIESNCEEITRKLRKITNNAPESVLKEFRLRVYGMSNTKGAERYWETRLAEELYSYILSHPNECFKNSQLYLSIYYYHRKVYYFSNCNISPCYYYLHLPEFPLCEGKEYKIVIDLTYGSNDFYCTDERRYIQEDVIHIFAPQVGHLLGNSIGETHYLDIVKHLNNLLPRKFPIFLIGYSNGAHAAWVLAQKYPHTITGIYTVSGLPYQKHMTNLCNIYICNISSTDDELYEGAYRLLEDDLKNFSDYKGYLARQSYHTDLHYWLYDSTLTKDMLSYKKNNRPYHFSFITKSNYHLQIYWIMLLPIKKGCKQINLEVNVKDKHIYINIAGAEGFLITKNFLCGQSYYFHINGRSCYYVKEEGKDITFYYNEKTDDYEKKSDTLVGQYARFSIAEFFYKSVDILLKDKNDALFLKLAQNLSSPKTFFLDMQSGVTYRIINDVEQAIENHNMVIIHHSSESCNISSHIQFRENGFLYKGKLFEGDYCVIGVQYHENKLILFITTNNTSLIKTNIFLRLMLIPSYANEYDSILNNQSLILFNNSYYSIYEWGDEVDEEKLF